MDSYEKRVREMDDKKYMLQLLIRTLENKAVHLEPRAGAYKCTVDRIMKVRDDIRNLEHERLTLTAQHIKADLSEMS